jgi:hypothetical protein
MSEESRRRTWIPVAQVNPKPNNCSVCGKPGASYSTDNGWSWFCWPCKPEKATWDQRND